MKKTFNTENKTDYIRFESDCKDLYNNLQDIRNQIAAKYQTKNTPIMKRKSSNLFIRKALIENNV